MRSRQTTDSFGQEVKSMSMQTTNEPAIVMEHVSKNFKVLNRREGLSGSIKDLFSRDYKTLQAVSDVSLSIEKGEIIGYLGPNGAGKSTTIKMMTGVLEPSEGKILVNGVVPYQNRSALSSDSEANSGGRCR